MSEVRATSCLNCDAVVVTPFCGACGQENVDRRVSFAHVLREIFDEVFQVESRLWRSLMTLLFRPGRLTREYNEGRRVRYTTPLRLYLLASVAYFSVLALMPPKPAVDVQVKLAATDKEKAAWLAKPPDTHASWLERKARALGQLPNDELARRSRLAFVNTLPRAVTVMVPLLALLLMLFFRGRFYVEHLTFALHAQAAAFLVNTPSVIFRSDAMSWAMEAAFVVWGVLAVRRAYGQSWTQLAWKLPLLALLITPILVVTVEIAVLIGVSQ